MAGNFIEVDNPGKRRFLNAYARLGGIRRAAEASDTSFQSHYHWLRDDAIYAAAFAQARIMAGDELESAAFHRAVDGVDKPVFQQGQQVGTIREYSDSLLQFLLRGQKRDIYGDKQEINLGGKVEIDYVNDWRETS